MTNNWKITMIVSFTSLLQGRFCCLFHCFCGVLCLVGCFLGVFKFLGGQLVLIDWGVVCFGIWKYPPRNLYFNQPQVNWFEFISNLECTEKKRAMISLMWGLYEIV